MYRQKRAIGRVKVAVYIILIFLILVLGAAWLVRKSYYAAIQPASNSKESKIVTIQDISRLCSMLHAFQFS